MWVWGGEDRGRSSRALLKGSGRGTGSNALSAWRGSRLAGVGIRGLLRVGGRQGRLVPS